MPSYRFCRPDDIPLLVATLNVCWDVHVPDSEPTTVTSFKREMKELDLWPSSCMIAYDGETPMGIVVGCKRAEENYVLRVGVNPGYQRKGHATHVLESLQGKLAVLGPHRMVTELPESNSAVAALFKKVGYKAEEASFADFVLPIALPALPSTELFSPITLDEVTKNRAFPKLPFKNAWCRDEDSLSNISKNIQGVSLVSVDRVEGFLLYRDYETHRECLCFNAPESSRRDATFALLARYASSVAKKPLVFPKVSKQEVPYELFERNGFKKGETYLRYGLKLGA